MSSLNSNKNHIGSKKPQAPSTHYQLMKDSKDDFSHFFMQKRYFLEAAFFILDGSFAYHVHEDFLKAGPIH